ncbi:beta-carotene hydroxylase 2, chloroplastic-like [Phalaenopsis equestris]|uniref:beta-carotene hydroxylase 2, chloroplastic-like n=1 Tax=Phalaenopsis equestris TaxID=78828 RepID=UPI0009E1F9BA|nr:beta-carotene hydroxylase 2, chloroplastic-like [Phalaenopsis equestris]
MAVLLSAASMNLRSRSLAKIPLGFSSTHRSDDGILLFSPLSPRRNTALFIHPSRTRRDHTATICFVMEESSSNTSEETAIPSLLPEHNAYEPKEDPTQISANRVSDRMARKRAERRAYLIAAVMSTFGITSMAVAAVYYRFAWQMEGGEVPFTEMLGTFSLSVGAAVGMEFWARWAHRVLWHASLWDMHESHHRAREGPFELNDVFAIINAVPAIFLLSYGFFHRGLVPGLCFGAGLGITLFGIAYMFVHDGLVHRRFPVGPIANVPYFRRVAAAHQIHHSDKFEGVPYGLFMGPKELEEVGGSEELEREIKRRIKMQDK